MNEERHMAKKWEISLAEISQGSKVIFKVTGRLPELSVSETKFFESKDAAKKQFDEWLS